MRVSRHRDGSSTCLQAPCRAWVSVYPISSAYCPQNQYYCSRKRLKLQYLLHNFSLISENSSFNPILRGKIGIFIKKHGISTRMEGDRAVFLLRARVFKRRNRTKEKAKGLDKFHLLLYNTDREATDVGCFLG